MTSSLALGIGFALVASSTIPGIAQHNPASSAPAAASAMPQAAISLDAIATRTSELDARARVDIFSATPYELLAFQEYDGQYVASYTARIVIRDSASRTVLDTTVSRRFTESDNRITRGATGKVDNVTRTVRLMPGRYTVEVTCKDQFSKREFATTRTISVADFTQAYPSIAGLLLVREVEQRGDRYRISPIVGDVIHQPESPFFVFFETYLDVAPRPLSYTWRIAAADGRIFGEGSEPPVTAATRTFQHFIPLRSTERPAAGSYTLTVRAHPVEGGIADTSVVLATATRPLVVPRSAASDVMSDLTKAIRQLRYVATQEQIDRIEGSPTPAAKRAAFDEFWRSIDPTPTTAKNEALEEYYQRITDANARFKSYAEGWLTDMGMVYVLYGQPANIDRFSMQSGMAVRIVWAYGNGMSFTFDDNTGFGDFRLRTPIPAGARYQWRR
jgi:GWxTD domain-containing protein